MLCVVLNFSLLQSANFSPARDILEKLIQFLTSEGNIDYKNHLNGALLTGAAVGLIAIFGEQINFKLNSMAEFIRTPWNAGEVRSLFSLFLLTVFMGLFPDLDIRSRPQKYYARFMVILLLSFFILGELKLLALVAILAFLPLIGTHRSWTHHWLVPFIFSLFYSLGLEYLRAKNAWFSDFSLQKAMKFLIENWMYPLAFFSGHYIHLVLDSKWWRQRFSPKPLRRKSKRKINKSNGVSRVKKV